VSRHPGFRVQRDESALAYIIHSASLSQSRE
jgi:hypothetical protein